MTDLQTVQTIQAHLDAHPADWSARMELADLLEEAGDLEQAKLQRWLVQRWLAPEVIEDGDIASWMWYATPPGWPGCLATLGARLFSLLPSMGREWGFSTRQEAEGALLVALRVCGWPAV